MTLASFLCFAAHRWYSLLLGVFNAFPFRVVIHGEKSLLADIRKGSVFISIHSGPYPLAVKAIEKVLAPGQEMVVPFYVASAKLFFRVFERWFVRFRVRVVPLGGAMTEIHKALSTNGSACLFLDANLPVKRVHMASMFHRLVPLSTGPVYLARVYNKSIVPLYVKWIGKEIHVYRLPPISYRDKSDDLVMKQIAHTIESMIRKMIFQWQPVQRYLLDASISES